MNYPFSRSQPRGFVLAALVALVVLCWSTPWRRSAQGEDWPCWRGPRGDGSSLEINAPTVWDGPSGQNVAWRSPLPGVGHSSPIVQGDRVFLTSCLIDSTERVLICLDLLTGKTLWQQTVIRGELETIHALNSRASGTPATDGRLVFVAFMQTTGDKIPAPNVGDSRDITAGVMVVAAYDFQGNQVWLVRPGAFISAHGFCSCPVVYRDLVIINGDHDGDSYVVALDRSTGKERWRYQREHGVRSYVTPIIREIDGRPHMVFSGSKQIISLNPNDGKLRWKIEGPTEQFVASMVFDGQLFYMACGYPDYYVLAIRSDGVGDVTQSAVAWSSTMARCYVPSPVVLNRRLLVADDRGTASCFDAPTGERLWKARLGNGFQASLVHANGLAYFVANDGTTSLVRPGNQPDIVAVNRLGEDVAASPAIAHGRLLIRGRESLFCIMSEGEDKK